MTATISRPSTGGCPFAEAAGGSVDGGSLPLLCARSVGPGTRGSREPLTTWILAERTGGRPVHSNRSSPQKAVPAVILRRDLGSRNSPAPTRLFRISEARGLRCRQSGKKATSRAAARARSKSCAKGTGVRPRLLKRPEGCFAQEGSDPFPFDIRHNDAHLGSPVALLHCAERRQVCSGS